MPLMKSKSKEAMSKNIKAEMDAGKPQKQAIAIAYAVKRKAPKKAMGGNVNQKLHPHSGEKESMKEHKCPGCGMKYAYGGMIPSEDNNHVAQDHLDQAKQLGDGAHDEHEDAMERIIPSKTSPESSNSAGDQYSSKRERLERMYGHMADGGMVEGPSPKDQEDRAGSRVQQVMRDRYALGGYVQPKNVNDQDQDEDSLDHSLQDDDQDDSFADLHLTDTYPQFDKEESDTMAQDMDEDKKRKKQARMGQIFEREYDND